MAESVQDTVKRIEAARRKARLPDDKPTPWKGPTPQPFMLKQQTELTRAVRRGDVSEQEAKGMGMTGGIINMLRKKLRIGGE